MLDAAQMALFDIKGSRLTLLPRDTGGTPDGAATAARDTLDQGASIVIGPLTAGEVQAVQPIAAERAAPILAFSTAAGLAGNGTYLFGFLPDDEVRRVVAVAHEKGVQRIAFLGPGTAYGHVIADSLKNAAAEQKIDLGPVIFFDPAVPQPLDAIHRLGSVGADGKVQLDGNALMLPMGSWYTGRAFVPVDKGGQPPDFPLGIMQFPAMDGGACNECKTSDVGASFAINAASKHKELAAEYMNAMSTPEMGKRWIETIYLQTAIKTDVSSFSGPYASYFKELMARQQGSKYFIGMPIDILRGQCKDTFVQVMNSAFPGGLLTVDKAVTMMNQGCYKK
jgi:hypothetical protein